MTDDPHAGLSAREREIMDIVRRRGEATAADVRADMDDPPTDATVRSALRVLEEKGTLTHRRDGARYVYAPTRATATVRSDALRHVVRTFFGGSVADAAAALLGASGRGLSDRERARVAALLDEEEA